MPLETAHVPPSRELLEAMLAHQSDFSYLFDRDGRFLYANRALLDLWGLKLEDAVGKNFYDLNYPPELADRLQRQIQEVLTTRHPQCDETPYTDALGDTQYYEYVFTPVFDGEGGVGMVAGTTRNISARKNAEVALAESHRLHAQILESIKDYAIFTISPSGIIQTWNNGAARLFGYNEEEVIGRNRICLWTEEKLKHDSPEEEIKQAHQTGRALAEGWFQRKDGSRFFAEGTLNAMVDDRGQHIGYVRICRDVTERRQLEAELADVQQRLSLAIEAAELGTFYFPLPLDEPIWNAKCQEHFWLGPAGKGTFAEALERVHPEDRWRMRTAFEEAMKAGGYFDTECRTVSPAGKVRWIHALGRCFRNDEGHPIRLDGITMDVTARRKAEADREQSLTAERAARTEAERTSQIKDEFLATLSHELRTPLNAILGWIQVLRSGKGGPDDLSNGLAIIERNARAQTKIIEDLLDMSSIISGKVRLEMQPLDLRAVVEGAIQTARPAAEAKGIKLQATFDSLPSGISGDPNRLQQVFWNLLSNAVKFTPKDGVVTVALARVASQIEVKVSDTGEGITAEFLPHVFGRFRQSDASTTRRHGGLGLGLAIVRQLVELHGGTIEARSAGRGQGATFAVHLPLAAVSPARSLARERRLAEDHASGTPTPHTWDFTGLRIVIVDDEAEARGLVRRLLEDCGAEVFSAASAAEAYEAIRQKTPDLLISDIGMPEEDGYSLIRKIRELGLEGGGATPAIALTAYARPQDRQRAIISGFQLHLSKPVEAPELLAMVANLTAPARAGEAGFST